MRKPCICDSTLINRIIAFHGHFCPGIAIGIRVAELALQQFNAFNKEDLIAVVESNMCGVDAIQFLTGCTLGKGNLVQKDFGKTAFSFYNRGDGKGFRAVLRPGSNETIGMELELRLLSEKLFNSTLDSIEEQRCEELKNKIFYTYMNMDLKHMFIITKKKFPVKRPNNTLSSMYCEDCGEMAIESHTRRFEGKIFCIPCFDKVKENI